MEACLEEVRAGAASMAAAQEGPCLVERGVAAAVVGVAVAVVTAESEAAAPVAAAAV